MSPLYIDFHCHPAMKPYGRSFPIQEGAKIPGRNKPDSIWYYDPPSTFDKVINYVGTLTKFRQSDFSSLSYGGAKVICASLYPLEKPFADTKKFGSGEVSDVMTNLAMGLGNARINHIQQMQDYFADLNGEYEFYKRQINDVVKLEGGDATYKLARNYDDLLAHQLANGARKKGDPEIISVVLTIEGAHVFNCGFYLDNPETTIEAINPMVEAVKKWEYPLFFITFAHHYYNNLVGHAPSLNSMLQKVSPQAHGLGLGFTQLGRHVLDALLSKTNGRRIYIDVKHMSPVARMEYYNYIAKHYADQDIPIIVSHGAVNGLDSPQKPVHTNMSTAGKFMTGEINFYDYELDAIARTNGIIGLQLDERRIASDGARKKAEGNLSRREIQHEHARLLWNQLQHIGEILDARNLPAWNCAALGTDFDGIIDPLNGFWTAEQFPDLEHALSKHAYNYLNGPNPIKNTFNKISVLELMENFFRINGKNFLQRYYR